LVLTMSSALLWKTSNPAVNADAPRRAFARLSRAGYLTR
jgi:hypothetical protein